jgi:cell division septation protein DedD
MGQHYATNLRGTLSLAGHNSAILFNAQRIVERRPRLCHYPDMAVKIPWKSLSKPGDVTSKIGEFFSQHGAFFTKRVAFFAAAVLFLAGGLVLRSGLFSGEPDTAQKAPVTIQAPASPDATRPEPSAATTPAPSSSAPSVAPVESVPKAEPPAQDATTQEQADQPDESVDQTEPAADEAMDQAGQSNLPDDGMILVSRRPVEVLSGPSTTASVMYGFPAGRQFRVIGRQGDFAQIKDVVSGASGWINEAALAEPPSIAAPTQSRPTGRTQFTADPKPKATRKAGETTAGSDAPAEPTETRKRPGLFGGGGPFRGLFGGGN